MLLTADKCTRLHRDEKLAENLKAQNGSSSSTGKRISMKERKGTLKQEEENSVPLEEKRPIVSNTKSKRLKDSFNKGSENSTLESNTSKVVKEPSDLYVSRVCSGFGYSNPVTYIFYVVSLSTLEICLMQPLPSSSKSTGKHKA